jgi:hypothetical protein
VSYVAEQIAKYGGQPQQSARSLYPYFFSSAEEEGIARRLDGDGCSRAAAALSGSAQRRDAGTRIVNI